MASTKNVSKTKSTNGGGGTYSHRYGPHLVWTYGPPWMIWLISPIVGAIVHHIWADSMASSAIFAVCAWTYAVGFALYLFKIAKPRGVVLQWLAAVSGFLGGVYLMFAGLVGPLSHPLLDVWFGLGLGVCMPWTARRAINVGKKDDGDDDDKPKGKAGALVDALDGGTIRAVEVKELPSGTKQITARVELDRGEQTAGDLQKSTEKLEGVLGLRRGAIRVASIDNDAGQIDMIVVPEDPLKGKIPWRGPSAPGESIHEPVMPGVYEDGTPCYVWFTGDDSIGRNLAQWLVGGVTGAGKSQALVVAMADALTRKDVVVWASDHVKHVQTFRSILGGIDWCVQTKKAAKGMLAATRRVVAARVRYLGSRGYDQWEPGCGIPLLIVWIEEAVELVADSMDYIRLVQQARSAGVVLIASLQRPSHTSIDTDARAQLTGNWCFGVRNHVDATFVLPDSVIDDGAHPDKWDSRYPGYSYIVAPGIPENKWAMPLRTFRGEPAQIAAAVAEWAHVRAPLDAISAQAAGDEYASRTPAADLKPIPMELEAVDEDNDMDDFEDDLGPGPAFAGRAGDGDDFDFSDDDNNNERGLVPMPPTLDPAFDDVDPEQPIPMPDFDMPLGTPGEDRPKLSPEAARTVVDRHLRSLLDSGEFYTKPSDLHAMRPPTGMSREWIRKEMVRRADPERVGADEMRLERDDNDEGGVYRIVRPENERSLATANGGRPAGT
jgi:hypothetical protein